MKHRVVMLLVLVLVGLPAVQALAADRINCWFPPDWKSKTEKAQAITQVLSEGTGLTVHPVIAGSYPEILSAFATDQPNLVYVGSFCQAIIKARGLGTALVQSQNGKELYSGILVYPAGQDPQQLLREHPAEIAYAVGASSGESTAKAATAGQAAVSTPNHGASCAAVKDGKARAAVVKNWWWEANRERFPGLAAYEIPRYSRIGNPDNVLTASNAVPRELQEKLVVAAMHNNQAFDARQVRMFDPGTLQFSLWLMEQGKIDPLSYAW